MMVRIWAFPQKKKSDFFFTDLVYSSFAIVNEYNVKLCQKTRKIAKNRFIFNLRKKKMKESFLCYDLKLLIPLFTFVNHAKLKQVYQRLSKQCITFHFGKTTINVREEGKKSERRKRTKECN